MRQVQRQASQQLPYYWSVRPINFIFTLPQCQWQAAWQATNGFPKHTMIVVHGLVSH